MIAFWVTDQGSFGIRNYRSHRGQAIAERFEPMIYEEIGREVTFPGGPQIFTALDQLTNAQRETVCGIWDAHARAAPGVPRLNDPRRVLLRFDLLTRLHQEGLNTFRVYHASEAHLVRRFPVFVRHKHRHGGPSSRLVHGHSELLSVLRALRLRGYRLDEHMIVEFCDASGRDGLFRKYAAFKVGQRILPCHVFASRDWCVKSAQNAPTPASVDEGLAYIAQNPHEAWLRRVFQVAGTDYGRVDYGFANGVPQVWEINLNPTIGRAAGQSRHTGLPADLKARRDEGRERFHAELKSAFLALDEGAHAPVRATIDTPLLVRFQADVARARRRERVRRWLTTLHQSPMLGRPVRALYALFPRH